jgi:hypothetical protein
LPRPIEQADHFVLWLGRTLSSPGEVITIDPPTAQAVMGAASLEGYKLVLDYLFDRNMVQGARAKAAQLTDQLELTLTFPGWDRFESLSRGASESTIIFMAMKYGDGTLDAAVTDHFAPAVEQAGFKLRRLDDTPRAGVIDDRMRVEIRNAVMLIADLTTNNPGAYWEAGFAEGLGRPVLYTCDARFFRREPPFEELGGVHFDTEHCFTVLWEPDKLIDAAQRLKDAIRATLPEKAKMNDD